jgi:hypothetical protein
MFRRVGLCKLRVYSNPFIYVYVKNLYNGEK